MNEPISNGLACNRKAPCTDNAIAVPSKTLLVADCDEGLTGTSPGLPNPNNPSDPLHQYIITRVAYANAPLDCWSDPTNCAGANDGSLAMFGAEATRWTSQRRHVTGSNLCFADGHTKWYAYDKITYDLYAGAGQN
jgi:prepilin-type processing-associated H-X9-DG protein